MPTMLHIILSNNASFAISIIIVKVKMSLVSFGISFLSPSSVFVPISHFVSPALYG